MIRVFLWFSIFLGSLGLIKQYGFPAAPPPVPTIRALDQPRCFPPGTLGVEGFLMCPDSLPSERQA